MNSKANDNSSLIIAENKELMDINYSSVMIAEKKELTDT